MADAEEPVALPAAESQPTEPPPRRRRWRIFVLGPLAIVVAVFAAVLVSVLTVDLGPNLRKLAEVEGSKYLQRPMHIGRLVAKLTPGVFEVHDLVIEGLSPADRPFLKAKTITVVLPWWTIVTKKLTIESVEMTDWDMVVETWPSSPGFPNGRHNFPRFVPDKKPNAPKRWFTSTLKWVLASRGTFTYEDHGTPWSTAARDLRVTISRGLLDTVYRGTAAFADSTITIQSYEPFRASMRSQFTIDGADLRFSRMDLVSDGARSAITGGIDLAHWPEQTYQIRSDIDFPTQKDIFFHGQNFKASGRADFVGTFHLFKGGRELKGTFVSPLAAVIVGGYDWRFPNLRGSVLWVPDRLEVTDATSGLLGGAARFDYRLAPFGVKDVPTRATWDVTYRDVDLPQLTDFLQTRGLRLAGRISGRNRLVWPVGKWSEKTGNGEVTAAAPVGVHMMTRELQADAVKAAAELPPQAGPFNPRLSLGYVPIAGHIAYTIDPAWISLDKSWTATEKTYVEFEGRTAYGDRSQIPFHVTSLDWQESDRVLAGIITAFGSPTGAIPLGGYGEFDGVMLETFAKPRIEGTFTGDHMRAWDVDWGRGRAKLVIQNSYVDIAESLITKGDSTILADGRFSLGYPRKDGGEEFNTRVEIKNRPLVELRHAFELDDYPIDGLLSGRFHVYGKYEGPDGFGQMVIDRGTAYGETFDTATSSLRFEGTGVRLDALNITKSTGTLTGAAWVAWDGNYSFNADGTKIPVESLAAASFKVAPLSGVLQFKASGTGTFDEPRYDVTLKVDDLFAGDEGIGQLTGHLGLRGELLTLDFEAASPRLQGSGSGRVALTEQMDAELTLQFRDTSLDPYLRFFEPRLSPFTNAVAAGTVRVVGELADIDHLLVDARVDSLDLKLFDYRLRNEGPIVLSLDQHVAEIGQLRLVGDGTQLEVGGRIGLHDSTIAVQASGDANLGILQGFFRDVRSSGAATLRAEINGPLDKPVFSGNTTIANGRFRASTLPALDAINGSLSFDAAGVRVEDIKARLGIGSNVTVGGNVALNGFALGSVGLTARGQRMTLRNYPQGFTSVVDADLALRGNMSGLDLTGTVTVHEAVYTRRFETNPDIFNLGGAGAAAALGGATPVPSTIPLRFNIDVRAQQSLRVNNNIARIWSSADLTLQGTLDRPILLGRAEIDRGDINFEGNRYVITRGYIDFVNQARIEPYFDIEAETRVRIPGQIYRVTINLAGTISAPTTLTVNSDPPLPVADIASLLLGQTTDLENAELRTLSPSASARSEEELMRALGSRLIGGVISAPIGRAVEQTLGLTTVQITPSFGTEGDVLTPSARLIIGKRISNRAYITFARALGAAAREQLIILEYDQNDRVGWVLTQTSYNTNTFSIEFRVRHVFF
jgi:hypothetical protein